MYRFVDINTTVHYNHVECQPAPPQQPGLQTHRTHHQTGRIQPARLPLPLLPAHPRRNATPPTQPSDRMGLRTHRRRRRLIRLPCRMLLLQPVQRINPTQPQTAQTDHITPMGTRITSGAGDQIRGWGSKIGHPPPQRHPPLLLQNGRHDQPTDTTETPPARYTPNHNTTPEDSQGTHNDTNKFGDTAPRQPPDKAEGSSYRHTGQNRKVNPNSRLGSLLRSPGTPAPHRTPRPVTEPHRASQSILAAHPQDTFGTVQKTQDFSVQTVSANFFFFSRPPPETWQTFRKYLAEISAKKRPPPAHPCARKRSASWNGSASWNR